MSTFSIQQLRDKYKRIIQSEDSEEENMNKTRITFAIKKGLNQTRVLTEHCDNMSKSKVKDYSSSSALVFLKERIAQGIQNLSEKDKQIQNYKELIIKQKSQITKLEEQLTQIKLTLQDNNSKLVQEKVVSATLEKQIQKFKGIIKEQHLDKQLIFKQIQFYKKQIKDLKNEKKWFQAELQKNKKQMQKVQRLKNDNSRLKDNIERMQAIINECCQQSVKIDLTDKYYLGKPYKESNCWFSQNLVGEIQSFLRKWSIGNNNKQFIDGLVKFIDQYQKCSRRSISCNKTKSLKSKHKDRESKRYSTSVQVTHDISTSQKSRIETSLKKSILSNKYKKKNNKIYTQSLFDQVKQARQPKIYEQMLDQYEKALKSALQQSEIKPKKIMLLSKELKQSFSNFMEDSSVRV